MCEINNQDEVFEKELKELYESPIHMIKSQMRMHMEGKVLKAVQNVGIVVDKEELLKALEYDRDQYSRGYEKGREDTADRLRDMFDYNLFKLYSNDDRFISFNNLSLMIRDMIEQLKEQK